MRFHNEKSPAILVYIPLFIVSFFPLLKKNLVDYFAREVLGLQKNWAKSVESSHIISPCPLFSVIHLRLVWYICSN